jgi:hypothetical protein
MGTALILSEFLRIALLFAEFNNQVILPLDKIEQMIYYFSMQHSTKMANKMIQNEYQFTTPLITHHQSLITSLPIRSIE